MKNKKSKADIFFEKSLIILKKLVCYSILPILIIAHYKYNVFSNFFSNYTKNDFSINDFSVATIGSFAGAIGAAAAVYYLDYRKQKRDLLIAVNTSLAAMAGHISTVMNYKVQHLIPLKAEKDDILNIINTYAEFRRANPGVALQPIAIQSRVMMQKLPNIQNEFSVDINRISEFAERFPHVIVCMIKAKENLDSFKSFVSDWRDLVDEIRVTEYEPDEKIGIIFGKIPVNGNYDNRVCDTIDNVLTEADNALFFLRMASEELQEKGSRILPSGVVKYIAKSTTKEKYEKYMPPRDLVDGWQDE